jgi:hypothetical protein
MQQHQQDRLDTAQQQQQQQLACSMHRLSTALPQLSAAGPSPFAAVEDL